MNRPVIDVGRLPPYAFGQRSLIWWGTMGMIVIEGTMFAMLIAAYFYMKGRAPQWPPGQSPPALLWGTLNTGLLLLSTIPNQLTKVAAEKRDLGRVRLWLAAALAVGLTFNIVRIFEFRALNVWWDENAYGSILWTLLGFHTFHIVTDFIDSSVLLALFFIGPLKESHFVDVADNAMYWYFVVVSWIPIYAVIYIVPRIA